MTHIYSISGVQGLGIPNLGPLGRVASAGIKVLAGAMVSHT